MIRVPCFKDITLIEAAQKTIKDGIQNMAVQREEGRALCK